ncbi:unnamed protein product [Gongylonema pulchrum]|uniref:Neuropeptide-Like Protein n=1 Tax=Gongylonema pulchrum TaxID=637853 RepID=A0A183D5G6_9BILA|nr:unnamed protein product [Gongylonema pulchrum]
MRSLLLLLLLLVMACGVALKRPYDEYLIAEGAEAKRARHTQAHCSPFRAQMGTIAASLPSSGPASALMHLRDPKTETNVNDILMEIYAFI